jgi:hypothetical protein
MDRAIRWLSSMVDECLERDDVIRATGLSVVEYERLIAFLVRRGCVEIIPVDGGGLDNFQVLPAIRSL